MLQMKKLSQSDLSKVWKSEGCKTGLKIKAVRTSKKSVLVAQWQMLNWSKLEKNNYPLSLELDPRASNKNGDIYLSKLNVMRTVGSPTFSKSCT